MEKVKYKIGIIGGGAMGGSLAEGLVGKRCVSPSDIIVSDPLSNKLVGLRDLKISVIVNNKEVASNVNFLVVAVKPWLVKEVIEEIKDKLDPEKTEICFIVAGVSGSEIYQLSGYDNSLVMSIVIPNTAMSLGKSMSFLVRVNGNPVKALDIFGKVGKVMEIDERLLPGATALASCGMAYAMRYVRAACEGGVELGFKASAAQEIVTQTLAGAVALLEQPGSHPELEIDKVTTPGGITIKGLNAMEKAGFTNAVISGLKASVQDR